MTKNEGLNVGFSGSRSVEGLEFFINPSISIRWGFTSFNCLEISISLRNN
jgi:hypothetical protein